jgi:hypothetical protein
MENVGPNWISQYYNLNYSVRTSEYSFNIQTILSPANSDIYDTAFSVISYVPDDISETVTSERVDFNSSVTLSSQYRILSTVADKIGKIYGKSGNNILEPFALNYHKISEETKYLSKLVKQYLPEYDKEIQSISAVLLDTDEDNVFACLTSILICLAAIAATPQVLGECALCYQLIACLVACADIFTVWLCVACIATGIVGCLICAGGFLAILDGCYDAGHCLGIW